MMAEHSDINRDIHRVVNKLPHYHQPPDADTPKATPCYRFDPARLEPQQLSHRIEAVTIPAYVHSFIFLETPLEMTTRTEKEMSALLDKIDDLIGPMDQWTDQALEALNGWLADTSTKVEHEWVKRDSNSEADA